MPPDECQIVLDENIPWSIATELRARGYQATSNYRLNASGMKDPEWLEVVANLSPRAVLVTYDNAMPTEHAEWLQSLEATLAVIDSRNRPQGLTLEQYWREIIHRHAHRFVAQGSGSWWRYSCERRRRLNHG